MAFAESYEETLGGVDNRLTKLEFQNIWLNLKKGGYLDSDEKSVFNCLAISCIIILGESNNKTEYVEIIETLYTRFRKTLLSTDKLPISEHIDTLKKIFFLSKLIGEGVLKLHKDNQIRTLLDEVLTPSFLQGDCGKIKSIIRVFYRPIRNLVGICFMSLLTLNYTLFAMSALCGITSFDMCKSMRPKIQYVLTFLASAVGLGVGMMILKPLGYPILAITATYVAYDTLLRKPYNFIKSLLTKSNDTQKLLQPAHKNLAPAHEPTREYEIAQDAVTQKFEKQPARTPSTFTLPNTASSGSITPQPAPSFAPGP